jgi:hypothetical protein
MAGMGSNGWINLAQNRISDGHLWTWKSPFGFHKGGGAGENSLTTWVTIGFPRATAPRNWLQRREGKVLFDLWPHSTHLWTGISMHSPKLTFTGPISRTHNNIIKINMKPSWAFLCSQCYTAVEHSMLIISHMYNGSLELFYGQFPSHRGVLVSVMWIKKKKKKRWHRFIKAYHFQYCEADLDEIRY